MDPVNVLMVGTGEYTTGYAGGANLASDKRAGVVGLTLFDLRRRGIVNRLSMAGTNGTKFPAIRSHLDSVVSSVYQDMDTRFRSFPDDSVSSDPLAYRSALKEANPGDAVLVFTPDDTHFTIAMDAIAHGCHTLVAKPLVKTVDEHQKLIEAAERANVLVAMEVHKRWDPIYADARDRIQQLGDFSFFQSYMSQPKSQLQTFRAWAGKSSDISYYLNAHHVDFHVWACARFARPVAVRASAAIGVASQQGMDTEDTITLMVDWENLASRTKATAIYTASWIAPKSDVHSQQRFFYMGHRGELTVDQAHRGFSTATDAQGYSSPNPLFMKYTPDIHGRFAGQSGYGYRSIEDFVLAISAISRGDSGPKDFSGKLATAHDTLMVTAILEAGRKSLDRGGCVVSLF